MHTHNINTNCYTFGIQKRSYSATSYRFGFNGMEGDDEIKGQGNSLVFGARIYDSRLGRWLSIDPLYKNYPSFSPYNFVANNPILFIDPDGRIIDISKLSNDEKTQYKAMLTILSQSDLHNYVYQALENSLNTYTIVFDNDLEGSGKFRPGTGTITINPNNVKPFKNVEVLSEEMFHAFQQDRKGELYPKGVSASNLETEGDLYFLYVQIELGDIVAEPVLLEGEGFDEIDEYSNYNVPSYEQVQSEYFDNTFIKVANDRYNNCKDDPNLPDSYKQKPSATKPQSLKKVEKEWLVLNCKDQD